MTYARFSLDTPLSGAVAGSAASASRAVSTQSTRAPAGGTAASRSDVWVTSTATSESSSM
jgi:hypothetical protein